MNVMSKRAERRIFMIAATAMLSAAVMSLAATRDRAPSTGDAQAAPRAVWSWPVGTGAAQGAGVREEAGMLIAGMILIGAAAAVRRAA